jgi:hypothetical protein
VHLGTCGTLELTMVFGLPVYWCVIPNINCSESKSRRKAPVLVSPLSEAVKDDQNVL